MSLVARDLIEPAWPAPPNVRAWMTTRSGGISTGVYGASSSNGGGLNLGLGSGDARDSVNANRARLRALLPAEPAWLQQVHGIDVVDASEGRADEAPRADASFTIEPGVVCAILVADCMPVLFCDRAGTRVAAAHAGWRGLAAGVLEATLHAGGFVPSDTIAWIGPAIGPTRFEVGRDVREAFVDQDAEHAAAFTPHGDAKWLADLPALAVHRLRRAGVIEVAQSRLCTASDSARFYSYRRDGATGRMAALVWME